MKDVIRKIMGRYNIYLTVHTDSELKEVQRLYSDYDNIECFKLDLFNEGDIFKFSKFKIDILLCNGAVMESGSLIDMPFKNIRDNFEVNFFSNLKLIKNVILNNDKVKIIVMSSLGGKITMPFCGAYSASKAALTQMMRALGTEVKLISKKIDIVVIEPGLYKTGFNEYGFDKKYEFMDIDSFFDEQLKLIRKSENIILKLFEKKRFDSITSKIVKAIDSDNPNFYYRAPFGQALFVKIYNFFA